MNSEQFWQLPHFMVLVWEQSETTQFTEELECWVCNWQYHPMPLTVILVITYEDYT